MQYAALFFSAAPPPAQKRYVKTKRRAKARRTISVWATKACVLYSNQALAIRRVALAPAHLGAQAPYGALQAPPVRGVAPKDACRA